ncbi:cell division protein CrgA [Actinotignum urinale]|uniref:Cell division protein CrgA n=1 Tax=Actinotignum urinale TaxID=190146 RepID=A0AAW9HNF1_9ACTO|nr:cell division protein CrgA [Actinotignum urinale]MDY5128457.1 cell division protein CrgA [Actinotignum urinale]MDY5132708.1 cell division protein CrgA [Actinotignum urinale]MDY5151203.1 cell division protein CrgA [Actinotignum urinale]MDY5155176.1 cell division protein CrgA [Actinotignum urinale]MDY5160538.1 cell division protein CrgA [Actinotignum urinale]
MSELNNLDSAQDNEQLEEDGGTPVRRSKTRQKKVRKPERRPGTQQDIKERSKVDVKPSKKKSRGNGPKSSPSWWAPVMCTLMIVGLICVVIAYISAGSLPFPGFNNGNLFIGFGLMIAGFLMTMGWH